MAAAVMNIQSSMIRSAIIQWGLSSPRGTAAPGVSPLPQGPILVMVRGSATGNRFFARTVLKAWAHKEYFDSLAVKKTLLTRGQRIESYPCSPMKWRPAGL